MSSKELNIIVTGIGGGGHGEQILKALRMSDINYHIIGTDTHPNSANRGMVDVFKQATPASNESEYISFIKNLCTANDIKAIFHGSEKEMLLLSKHKKSLKELGVYVPVNDLRVLEICQDKCKTMSYLQEKGFKVPFSKEISSLDGTKDIAVYPLVLKPSVGGGGSSNVYIAQDQEELKFFTIYLLKSYQKIIVQEYIGTPDQEYTVGVLFDQNGNLINSIVINRVIYNALSIRTRVKNKTSNTLLGDDLVISSGVSQGVILGRSFINEQCEQIASSLSPTAPVNIQCRVVNGNVIPFEINPRFSGTTSLRAMAGYNEPDALIRNDVFNEKVERHFPYNEMTIMRSLAENIMTTSGSK